MTARRGTDEPGKGFWWSRVKSSLDGLESLDGVGLDDLGGGLGLEDAGLLSERVDALALLGGGLLLDDEAGHAGEHKLAALGELTTADVDEGLEDGAALLAREAGLGAHVVQKLGLGEVGTLGLDRSDDGLDLGLLLGDLGGDLLASLLNGLLGGLGDLLDDLLALGSCLLADGLLGSHDCEEKGD